MVEGRASIVTSPGGTAAPGSWIHHVGVLNADCLFTNFYYYKGNEEAYARDERPIPTKIGMFVDYSWFVCLALTGKFLPTCYVLQITYKNIPTDKK